MAKGDKVKEGSFLLGDPTFVEIGGGRWRCVETGQEMPEKEKDSYSKSRACRVGLIDAAVAKRKAPLNTFEQHPISKSQLICKLTGDTVNKTEEQIWKHISGRRFQNKLEMMELQANSPSPAEPLKDKTKSKELVEPKKFDIKKHKKDKKKKNKEINNSDNVDSINDGGNEKKPDFWMPRVGKRWDCDDGRDIWDACQSAPVKEDSGGDSGGADDQEDSESNKLATSTKRLSIAVGPSSFAPRKKKMKRDSQAAQNGS